MTKDLRDQIQQAVSAAIDNCIRNDSPFGAYASVATKAVLKVLERQKPTPSVPDGWKLVPIEPTQEMRDAWISHTYSSFRVAYQAMLAAAAEIGRNMK